MSLPTPTMPAPGAGAPLTHERIVAASRIGTAAFTLACVLSAVWRPLHLVSVVVSTVLFLAGCVAFVWALTIAADRSRTEAIGIGGLYLMLGSVPRRVQVELLGALVVQIAVAVGTAAVRPFTDQAFAVLGPMYGLGLCGLWTARHGTFGPRSSAAADDADEDDDLDPVGPGGDGGDRPEG